MVEVMMFIGGLIRRRHRFFVRSKSKIENGRTTDRIWRSSQARETDRLPQQKKVCVARVCTTFRISTMHTTNNTTTSSSSSPDGDLTEMTTPLLQREPLDDDDDDDDDNIGIAQELGGHKYVLNPSRKLLNRQHDAKDRWRLWLARPVRMLKWTGIVVLSPILLFSTVCLTTIMYISPKSLQHIIIAPFLSKICACLDTKLSIERTTLLKNIHGNVLDLGCGSGQYFQYYTNKNCSRIVALEPIRSLHSKIQQQAEKYLSSNQQQQCLFELYDMTLEEYLQQQQQQQESMIKFDWIILGNVLCEVDNVQRTLQSVDRALKVGGMVYFSEHVACSAHHHQTIWRRRLQFLFNPIWKTLSGGCNINRDSLVWIQSMRNWKVISWDYSSSLRVGLGPFVLGLAQKVSN
jgi:SAM-dependent methyltransferase